MHTPSIVTPVNRGNIYMGLYYGLGTIDSVLRAYERKCTYKTLKITVNSITMTQLNELPPSLIFNGYRGLFTRR
jgi:hypothetical protein